MIETRRCILLYLTKNDSGLQIWVSFESAFDSVECPIAEPFDLCERHTCIAEEEHDCIELDQAEEKWPDVAALDKTEIEWQDDWCDQGDGGIQILVDEEVLDISARSFQEGKTCYQTDHAEGEHKDELVRSCNDHSKHHEAEKAEETSNDEADDSVSVALVITEAIEDSEPSLRFRLLAAEDELLGTLQPRVDALTKALRLWLSSLCTCSSAGSCLTRWLWCGSLLIVITQANCLAFQVWICVERLKLWVFVLVAWIGGFCCEILELLSETGRWCFLLFFHCWSVVIHLKIIII